MKYLVMIPLVCASFTLQAAVYKCSDASGKTVYQASPCQSNEKSRELAIKTDPKVEMAAKIKFEALQMQLAADKAQKQQAAEEESRQKYRTEQLEALKRNTAAQQQRAIAEQRAANTLERQNQMNTSPITLVPPFVSSMPPAMGITSAPAIVSSMPTTQSINQETSRPITHHEAEMQSARHEQPEQQQSHAAEQKTIAHVPPVQSGSPPLNHQNPEPQSKDEHKH